MYVYILELSIVSELLWFEREREREREREETESKKSKRGVVRSTSSKWPSFVTQGCVG